MPLTPRPGRCPPYHLRLALVATLAIAVIAVIAPARAQPAAEHLVSPPSSDTPPTPIAPVRTRPLVPPTPRNDPAPTAPGPFAPGTARGARTTGAVAPLIATLALDRSRARPDEQLILTLEVGVPREAFAVRGGRPRAEGARLIALGREQSEREIGGLPYRVTRSRYALFANAVGEVTIPALVFRATLPVVSGSGTRRNPRIEAETEALRLEVVAPPPEPERPAGASWLPALDLAIASRWRTTAETGRILRAGEPATWEIEIRALGQLAETIPPLGGRAVDGGAGPEGLRLYPEPARLDTEGGASGVRGTRVERSVVVAERTGELTLPERTLHWWDVAAGEWRVARLAAERLTVLPALDDDGGGWTEERRLYRIALLSLAGLCAVLAATNVLLWRRRRSVSPGGRSGHPRRVGGGAERARWRRLRRALRRRDARAARAALRDWTRGPAAAGGISLASLARDDTALAGALARLDEHLYAEPAGAAPDFRALGRALGRARRRALSATPSRSPRAR